MSIFEQKWFKWAVVGSTTFTIIFVSGFLMIQKLLEFRAIQQIKEEKRYERLNREYRFRTTMSRIRQNLTYEHYLAAHKNMEQLPLPPKSEPDMVREYLEVLGRVGEGLFTNGFLEEAEAIFHQMKDIELNHPAASLALQKVDSKRRLKSALRHKEQGLELLQEKNYRSALAEFERAQGEFRSVVMMKYDDVDKHLKEIAKPMNEARFHVLVEESWKELEKSEEFIRDGLYLEAQALMSNTALKVGRAAFYNQESPEIEKLRKRLRALDAELVYRAPNAIPIWNLYAREKDYRYPNHFYLEGYDFQPLPEKPELVKVGLKYRATSAEKFFVVRYRIYFFDGSSIFNGFFLEQNSDFKPEEETSIVYAQEIPEELRGLRVQRIELRIFDFQDVIVSQVVRAFKEPS